MPKQLSSDREYEDAWASQPKVASAADEGSDTSLFRVAIADGATSTSYSQLWARLIVRATVRGQLSPGGIVRDLQPLQRTWRRVVTRKPLPWYAEQKLEDGAFAAFASLELRPAAPNEVGECASWTAFALGDACMVHLRGGRVMELFPVQNSADFGFNPLLLSSRPDRNEVATRSLSSTGGAALPGDTFFLMTDALAQWFMKSHEEGAKPWEELEEFLVEPQPSFSDWISKLRRHRRIKDDDVTLVTIGVDG